MVSKTLISIQVLSFLASCLILPLISFSQSFEITGEVVDFASGAPIEFASVYLQGTNAGGYSDAFGKFRIITSALGDTLIVSEVNHLPVHAALNKTKMQGLRIELHATTSELQEVQVVVERDPAGNLMKRVVAHKSFNDARRLKKYSYQTYSRVELDVNNLSYDNKKKQHLPQAMLASMNRLDTQNVSKGQLPIYFVETISDNVHHAANINDEEKIIAQKTLGMETDKVFKQMDKFQFDVNIYDNWIPLFHKTFASPITDRCIDFYKFYIVDTTIENDQSIITVKFVPRKHENAFQGYIRVVDGSYAIADFKMSLSNDANLNFVQGIDVSQEFKEVVSDSVRLFIAAKTSSTVRFQTGPDLIGIPTGNNSKSINASLSTKKIFDKFNFGDSSILLSKSTDKEGIIDHTRDKAYWESNRPDSLTLHEQAIYKLVDTLNADPRFKLTTKLAAFVGTGFWDFGNKWRIGPYSSFISADKIEGLRIRSGIWSLPGISEHWNLNGYLAYGTKDQKFKGGIGVKYLHSTSPWSKTSVFVRSDYDLIIDYDDELDRDNIISSLLIKNTPSYRSYINEVRIQHEEEIKKALTGQISFSYKEYNPVFSFQYKDVSDDDYQGTAFTHMLPVSEINTLFRYAPGQKYTLLNYDRMSLYNTHPVFSLSYTYGFELLNSEFVYHKISVGISQNLKLPPKATLYYHLSGGKTFGVLPYILLDVPNGNQYYVSSKYSFNTMAPYEFVADKYVSLRTRLSLGGLLLDHIPYLQKLQWRERISFNSFLGGLSNENRQYNAHSGTYVTDKVPFAEVGVGIENIFHSVSIEYYWRLTHLNNKYATPHGLFLGVSLSF